MGHGSVRQKLALDMGPIIVGSCTTGDPMCVEPWEPLSSASSKTPRSEGSPARKAAKRSHLPVQPESTTAHDEVLPAPASPKSAARQAPEGVKTRQTNEGWEYDFDGDPMAAWNRFSDMIRGDGVREKPSVTCFKPFTTALSRADATRESVVAAHVEMLRCANTCLTAKDAQFLTSCVDWDTLLTDPTERLRPAADFLVSAASLVGFDVAHAMESTLEQLSLDHQLDVLEGRVKTECTEEEIRAAVFERKYSGGFEQLPDGRCRALNSIPLIKMRRAQSVQMACTAAPDIMLVLDRSIRVNEHEMRQLNDAAKAFVRAIKPSAHGAHMGLVNFSNFAEIELHLTNSRNEVTTAISRKTSLFGGGADLHDGLLMAGYELSGRNGSHDRDDRTSPDFVILITNPIMSSANDAGAPDRASRLLKRSGVQIYVVAVGNGIDCGRPRYVPPSLATSPDHYFWISDYSELSSLLRRLATECH